MEHRAPRTDHQALRTADPALRTADPAPRTAGPALPMPVQVLTAAPTSVPVATIVPTPRWADTLEVPFLPILEFGPLMFRRELTRRISLPSMRILRRAVSSGRPTSSKGSVPMSTLVSVPNTNHRSRSQSTLPT